MYEIALVVASTRFLNLSLLLPISHYAYDDVLIRSDPIRAVPLVPIGLHASIVAS